MIKVKELNTSHSVVSFINEESAKKQLIQTLSIEREGWQFDYLVKIGRKSKYDFHFSELPNGDLLVNSGILEIPPIREILQLPDITKDEERYKFNEKVVTTLIENCNLPYEVYEYQKKATVESLSKTRKLNIMCTGSGKSLTISLCLEAFRRWGLKGVLVVPNINLLTQFANDIKSYNLLDLHSNIITFGGGSKKLKQLKDSNEALKPGDLVITTWQSLIKLGPEFYKSLDFVVCDEVHKFSSECTSKLILDSSNTKFKLGFSGTLPDSKSAKLKLLGLFGIPETFVTPQDLIAMGRGTPIHITAIKAKHNADDSFETSKLPEFLDKLKNCIKIEKRTNLVTTLASKMRNKSEGSTLVLYTLIDHGVELFIDICKQFGHRFNEIPPLEWQHRTGIYFMSGSCTAKDREEIRNAMDDNPEAILVANYALLSTGVNIKSLRYAIFASPVKSGVTVAQSLGRGIRLSEGKERFDVYDIVDDMAGCRIFVNQYRARKKIYEKLGYQMEERNYSL